MAFIIPGSVEVAATAIVQAVRAFPARYHRHFASVRTLGVHWLSNPCESTAEPLAHDLERVLPHWGAGKRLAAEVQPFPMLMETLTSGPFIEAMLNLRDAQGHLDADQVAAALSIINGGMVTSERTFLYSQKTLMLIAGTGPCLDSQVRQGLRRLNLRGFSSPYVACRVLHMNMAADQWSRDQRDAIAYAAQQDQTVSRIVELQSPARLIDVILFVGGGTLQWENRVPVGACA